MIVKTVRPLEGAHVLVVEDDPDILELHAISLREAGADVHAVGSAHAALDALDAGASFDVIVSDLSMPELDGFELMRRVRARGGRAAVVPALAVTALGDDDHVDEAARAGFHAHVRKPLAPDDLVLAIACLVPARGRGPGRDRNGHRAGSGPETARDRRPAVEGDPTRHDGDPWS
ncbi:response regulator [Sandaracinus amylolyticus]|uniref:response regulator n=1 Tax=Sandaracinus amylolyticus TaxID=927083 RepID=UPI001F1E48E8|nr:response regulator [Sandaracinus amylolyticus]